VRGNGRQLFSLPQHTEPRSRLALRIALDWIYQHYDMMGRSRVAADGQALRDTPPGRHLFTFHRANRDAKARSLWSRSTWFVQQRTYSHECVRWPLDELWATEKKEPCGWRCRADEFQR
jgi:hypothetical protein